MDLRLYDTLTREKRPFVPLDPKRVRMYVCGPTVYDFAHIGNARPFIVFDVLFRLLRHLYGAEHVVYVRNITDVDDKINARAAEEYPNLPLNRAIRLVTGITTSQFHRDVAALGALEPTVEPRATGHIAEMKALIKKLVASGHAYVAEDHVLFSVPSMPDYGRLSRRPLDEMIAGARVEVAPYKRDPTDFVLWKPSKPGEPAWPSPAGIKRRGRPGWHIECSAMSWKHLGETFDIHGGGIDLVFPHHENEIAQSRSALHTPVMANYWMHNGFLQVEGAKMAKSEGNFFTIRQLLETNDFGGRPWNGNILRFAMLQTHYSQPLDWTVRLLEQSEARLTRWQDFVSERTLRRTNKALFSKFISALADDLNTPEAFSIIDEAINKDQSPEDRYTVYRVMRLLGVRARKTRITRLAEAFQKRTLELSRFVGRDDLFAMEALKVAPNLSNEAQIRIAAYLDALAAFWRENNFASVDVSQFANEVRILEAGTAHPKKSSPETVADRLNELANELGTFTHNDWINVSKSATERPRFRSGKLKPETLFFYYLGNLNRLSQEVRVNELSSWAPYSQLIADFLSRARPAESDFETRVRRLVSNRDEARRVKNFREADRIRNELNAMGIELEDKKDGTTLWKVKR